MQVLASPVFPIAAGGFPRALAEAALAALKDQFEVVVIDAPSVVNGATLAALQASSVVGLVVEAEAPSIQAAVGTLRVLKNWGSKFQAILNQTVPGSTTGTVAIERALKMPVLGAVPYDPGQGRALASRIPITLSDPTAPLAEASLVLAQSLLQAAEASLPTT